MQRNNPMIENLERLELFSITTTTTVVKVHGPTDTLVVTATNPAGNEAVGQSSTSTITNAEAAKLK